MLKEKDLDIVLIGTPDHWHALPMIAAVEAGADVYVQKPISVDVVEGEAMVAAARKHGRVVQVGTQRRSTPHLVEARDQIVREGKLGKIGLVEIYCYYHMRAHRQSARHGPARVSRTTKCGPVRRRCGRTTSWRIRAAGGRSWNMATASWATCASTCSTWSAGCSDLGWPTADFVGRRHPGRQSGARPTFPTRKTATFDYGDLHVVWQHRTWGDAPDPKYPWGATLYGDKGTLKASVISYDFIPFGGGQAIHKDVTYDRASARIVTTKTFRIIILIRVGRRGPAEGVGHYKYKSPPSFLI